MTSIASVTIGRAGVTIEAGASDPYLKDLASHATALAPLAAMAKRVVPPGGCILDVGANIGLSAITLSLARPDCRIIALEPSPSNLRFLHRNLIENDIHNVTVVDVAASDGPGELRFCESYFGAGSHVSSSGNGEPVEHSISVRTDSIDAIVASLGVTSVSLVKIDVEGHEPNVLAGARGVVLRDNPTIHMEFNSWCLSAFGGHNPAAFAHAIWKYFEVLEADESGNLNPVELDALSFLHRNLLERGCVDDIALRMRPRQNYPSLEDLTGTKNASRITELEDRVEALEHSTSWAVTAPLRKISALIHR